MTKTWLQLEYKGLQAARRYLTTVADENLCLKRRRRSGIKHGSRYDWTKIHVVNVCIGLINRTEQRFV